MCAVNRGLSNVMRGKMGTPEEVKSYGNERRFTMLFVFCAFLRTSLSKSLKASVQLISNFLREKVEN